MSEIENILKDYDLSDVDRADRETVANIMNSALKFETPEPALKFDVQKVGTHYNLSIKNFNRRINLENWVMRFRDERHRDSKVEAVYGCSIDPANKLLILHIQRGGFSEPRSVRRTANEDRDLMAALGGRVEKVTLVQSVSLDDVNKADRPVIEDILFEVFMFEQRMPLLDVQVFSAGNHYNISIRDFAKEISLEEWVNRFRGASRDPRMDAVEQCAFLPTDGIMVLQVNKREFSASRSTIRRKRRY
jgi:hypothetical protein